MRALRLSPILSHVLVVLVVAAAHSQEKCTRKSANSASLLQVKLSQSPTHQRPTNKGSHFYIFKSGSSGARTCVSAAQTQWAGDNIVTQCCKAFGSGPCERFKQPTGLVAAAINGSQKQMKDVAAACHSGRRPDITVRTHAMAAAYCQSLGDYGLCDKPCTNKGCGYDREPIWTSTSCVPQAPRSIVKDSSIAMTGDGADGSSAAGSPSESNSSVMTAAEQSVDDNLSGSSDGGSAAGNPSESKSSVTGDSDDGSSAAGNPSESNSSVMATVEQSVDDNLSGSSDGGSAAGNPSESKSSVTGDSDDGSSAAGNPSESNSSVMATVEQSVDDNLSGSSDGGSAPDETMYPSE